MSTTAFPPQGQEHRNVGYEILHDSANSHRDEVKAKYPHYLPIWRRDILSPALEPFEYYDHGKDADPAFPDLLGTESRIDDMTPATGSIVSGVQLSSLSDKGKDQLALLVAQRKVLSFTDQDFSELPIPTVLDFCGYFGRFQVHPVGGSPDGYPEIHIAHNGGGDTRLQEAAMGRITSMSWHTDGSASEQPPGIVFLYMLECPKTGGDTIFSNQVQLYNKLSPAVRERLHGLKTEHSDISVISHTRNKGGYVKREGVTGIHPLVRTHPVTGEKALFVNPLCKLDLDHDQPAKMRFLAHHVDTTKIIGFQKEESDALLTFLFNHIASSIDSQVRVKWAEKTVVLFDNRAMCHSGIFDFVDQSRRHLARITLQAERPYETPFEADTETNNSKLGGGC